MLRSFDEAPLHEEKENNAILVVHAEAVCVVNCEAMRLEGAKEAGGKCKREPLHGTRLAAKKRGPGQVLCRFSPCGKGHREVQEFKRQLNGTGERKKLVVVVVE